MRHRSVLLAWLTAAATAVIATEAPAASTATFDDACGDNTGYVAVQGMGRQALPTTMRTPSYDLRSTTFTAQRDGGVQARLSMCAAIGDDTLGGYRFARAALDEDCTVTVGVQNGTTPAQPRRGFMRKSCYDAAAQEERLVFDVTLPAGAVEIAGKDLTITVRPGDVLGAASSVMAPGTTWSQLSTLSSEYETGTVGGGSGNGGLPGYEIAGPSALDFSGSVTAAIVLE